MSVLTTICMLHCTPLVSEYVGDLLFSENNFIKQKLPDVKLIILAIMDGK